MTVWLGMGVMAFMGILMYIFAPEMIGVLTPVEEIRVLGIQSLRIEAKQKLNLYRPINIGQASRISGVSPADISVLLVYLGHK